ncbi:MAG: manganese efflux pump, partial [Bacteroides sp.]|nr:manganese efflux pump [Bacteroides sp.]
MSILEIWLLAVSLAMDCFSVSITSGMILRRICWRTFLT